MTSKDALEILNIAWSGRMDKDGYPNFDDINEALYTLKQDLEVLETFEDNIKIHKETIKMQHNQIESLQEKNVKLKHQNKKLKDKIYNYKLCANITEPFHKLNKMKVEKLEKVIEILKGKGVQESFLKNTKNVHEYNKAIKHLNYFDELTQEEYDLLKEYL